MSCVQAGWIGADFRRGYRVPGRDVPGRRADAGCPKDSGDHQKSAVPGNRKRLGANLTQKKFGIAQRTTVRTLPGASSTAIDSESMAACRSRHVCGARPVAGLVRELAIVTLRNNEETSVTPEEPSRHPLGGPISAG